MQRWARLRDWAEALRRDVLALWFACRDPATPLLPKLLAGLIVAYALSPIDLIPDFIPILGFIDELILLPGALYLVIKLIPEEVMTRSRAHSSRWFAEQRSRPTSVVGGAIIVLLWGLFLYVLWRVFAARLLD